MQVWFVLIETIMLGTQIGTQIYASSMNALWNSRTSTTVCLNLCPNVCVLSSVFVKCPAFCYTKNQLQYVLVHNPCFLFQSASALFSLEKSRNTPSGHNSEHNFVQNRCIYWSHMHRTVLEAVVSRVVFWRFCKVVSQTTVSYHFVLLHKSDHQ